MKDYINFIEKTDPAVKEEVQGKSLTMYVFTLKHLSPIQKGIQASHAIVEYYNEARIWSKEKAMKDFNDWAHNDKTIILLNGGNVKELDELSLDLQSRGIHCGMFRETDLDGICTAIAVLVEKDSFNNYKNNKCFDYKLNLDKCNDYTTIANGDWWRNCNDFYKNKYWKANATINNYQVHYCGGDNNNYLNDLVRNAKLAR